MAACLGVALLAGVGTAAWAACPAPAVTVNAGQTVTNSAALNDCVLQQTSPVIVFGDNSTFTNTGSIITTFGRPIEGAIVPAGVHGNNITINNSGLMQVNGGTFQDSALQYYNSTALTLNNLAGGTISFNNTNPLVGSNTIEFGSGINGAALNNAGTIDFTGDGHAVIAISNGAQNVLINNQAGGSISAIVPPAGLSVGIAVASPSALATTRNVTIQNAGVITVNWGPAIALITDSTGGAVNSIANVSILNTGQIIGGANSQGMGAIVVAPTISSGPLMFSGFANVTGLSITNYGAGVIDGQATAIAIDNSRNIAASTITNSGTILGSVQLGSGGDTVNNLAGGRIDASTGFSIDLAIRLGNGATVNNAGTIINTGGIGSASAATIGTIQNAGAQNVLINNQIGSVISATGAGLNTAIAFGSTALGAANNFTIQNAGLITSSSGPAIAMFTDSAGGAVRTIANVSITNSGSMVGGANAFGLGTIVVAPFDASAVTPGFSGLANVTGLSITNSGVIDGLSTAIAIDNSRNIAAASITNSGTILGNILLGRGGDTVTFTGGTMQGNIVGQWANDTVRFDPGTGGSVSMIGNVNGVSLIDFASGTTNIQFASNWVNDRVRLGPGAVAAVQGSANAFANTITTVITGDGTTSGRGSTNLGRATATGAWTFQDGTTVIADLSHYSAISNGARYVLAAGGAPATVGSISTLSTLPIYSFAVLRGDAGDLGQSANDVYLVAQLNPAAQSVVAPQPQVAQALDNSLRVQTFDVANQAIGEMTGEKKANGKVDVTPEFGIWTSGRLGQSQHSGFNVTGIMTGSPALRGASTAFTTQDQSYMAAAQLDVGKWAQFETAGWRIGLFGGYGDTLVDFKSNAQLQALGIKDTGSGNNETGFAGLYSLTSIGNFYGLLIATGAMGRSHLTNPVLSSTGQYDTQGLVGGGLVGVVIPLSNLDADQAASRLGLDLRVGASYSFNHGAAFTDSIGSRVSDTFLQTAVGTVAAKLFYAYNEANIRFSPFVQLGYNQRFLYDNTVSVGDTEFRFEDASDSIYAATGVDFSITDKIQMNLGARAERSTDQIIYSGGIGLKIVFN